MSKTRKIGFVAAFVVLTPSALFAQFGLGLPQIVWDPHTEAQMADVKKYRAEGESLHKAGKHQESLDTLAKAEKILGIQ